LSALGSADESAALRSAYDPMFNGGLRPAVFCLCAVFDYHRFHSSVLLLDGTGEQ
jgi:hypothetical protein